MTTLHPIFFNRVKKYLDEHVNDHYMDVGVMAKQLHERYPEYASHKYKPFRATVEQAYRIILHSDTIGLESQPPSNDSDDSDLEIVDVYMLWDGPNTNLTAAPAPKQSAADVIVSDEDQTKGKAQSKTEELSFLDVTLTKLANVQAPSTTTTTPTYCDSILEMGHKRIELSPTVEQAVKIRIGEVRQLKQQSRIAFQDVGGMDNIRKDLCETLMYMKSPDEYFALRQMPPRSTLLYGPPGCGKTLLVHAIARELNLPVIEIFAHEFIADVACVCEERIREIFEHAAHCAPCVFFIAKIDDIFSEEDIIQEDIECCIVSQLVSSLDYLKQSDARHAVVVIATATYPCVLHPDLRSEGRFDYEIAIPSQKDRKDILTIICDGLSVDQEIDFDKIADMTPGYVGADLVALAACASENALKRINKTVDKATNLSKDTETVASADAGPEAGNGNNDNDSDPSVTYDDFLEALKVVQHLSKGEHSIIAQNLMQKLLDALHDKEEQKSAPIAFSETFELLGLSAPSDLVLYGPPGCAKSLLAKTMANKTGMNFISVKGSELMNMNVSESEHEVRNCFQRARNLVPCIIFFDEFDSLFPERSETNEGSASTCLADTLLIEMYEVENRQGVYILFSTNCLDIINPVILRPGRLDIIIYIGLPAQDEREKILKETTKNGTRPILADDVDFLSLAASTNGYSGPDLKRLVGQAAKLALKETPNVAEMERGYFCVRKEHFEQAIKLLKPRIQNFMKKYTQP